MAGCEQLKASVIGPMVMWLISRGFGIDCKMRFLEYLVSVSPVK